MESISDSPGQRNIDKTLALARVIADMCLTSGLETEQAVQCALDIARRLIEAHSWETNPQITR